MMTDETMTGNAQRGSHMQKCAKDDIQYLVPTLKNSADYDKRWHEIKVGRDGSDRVEAS